MLSARVWNLAAKSLVMPPAAALEPVVDELPLEPLLDHRPVQPDLAGACRAARPRPGAIARDLPAGAGQADLGRVDGGAVGLAEVVGEEQVDRLRLVRVAVERRRGSRPPPSARSMPGSSAAALPRPAVERQREAGRRGRAAPRRRRAPARASRPPTAPAVRQAAAISAAARAPRRSTRASWPPRPEKSRSSAVAERPAVAREPLHRHRHQRTGWPMQARKTTQPSKTCRKPSAWPMP